MASSSTEPPRRIDATRALVLIGVFALGTGFALFTRHIADDFLIAYRYSVNLAQGHGLVYTPGERVQGFSSPLGVLVPAAIVWLSGSPGLEHALAWLRILNGLCLGGAAVLLLQIGRSYLRSRAALVLLGGRYRLVRVFDARPRLAQVAFSPAPSALYFDSVYLVYRRGPSESGDS